MHAMWGLGLMSLSKSVVVVDEHVDVHDYEQVFFYACANVDPARDILLSEGPIDQLDHATTIQAYGGKIGIDATAKGPDEGRREWPPEIEMSAEIRAPRRCPLGRVRRSRLQPPARTCRMGRAHARRHSCYVVDTHASGTVESPRWSTKRERRDRRQATSPGSQPLADRLRDRDRLHPRRARRQLARGRARRRPHDRLRSPLDPRHLPARMRRSTPQRPTSSSATRRPRPRPPPRTEHLETYGRAGFLTLATIGLGGVIGAGVVAALARLRRAALVHGRGRRDERRRPRADHELPRRDVRDHHLHRQQAPGRGLEAHGLHPEQRAQRRRRSRASRSSTAAASTSAARCSRTGPSSRTRP